MNIQKQTLHNWDLFGSRELHDKPEYTQVISFVLSQAFDSTSRFYDNRLVYDLLLGKKSQSYTIETLDVFMADLDTFKLYWGNTKTNYVDESASLVKIFEDNFDMFSHQEYFDRLKSYWLKQKIHQ